VNVARTGTDPARPAQAVVMTRVFNDPHAHEPVSRERIRQRSGFSISLPWVLVLVQTVALIVSGMIGLVIALFV
jgi:hypothetical protein